VLNVEVDFLHRHAQRAAGVKSCATSRSMRRRMSTGSCMTCPEMMTPDVRRGTRICPSEGR
jgi:hypothetical protein